MPLIDVTVPLDRFVPTYQREPGPSLASIATLEAGDEATVSTLHVGVHCGTHVEAPGHVLAGGAGVESLPLEAMIGRAEVVEIPISRAITAQDLEQTVPAGTTRLLIKTTNGALWESSQFQTDFVALDVSAARWVVDHGIRVVGIDYLSIEPFGTPGLPTHRALLEAGIVILEGLDLRPVPPGTVRVYCLPLKLIGADGAPARVVVSTS